MSKRDRGPANRRADRFRPGPSADPRREGEYDPDATSELWETFIHTIFGGDEELISYVQRLLGYCCTGVIREHVLAVLHGTGANGKSALQHVVQTILGDHAMTAPEGLVIKQKHEPHPERIAVLRGRRLVVSNELEATARLAEQQVKQLTGGDDLSGREMYGKRFTFTPSHKILLVTNHKPKVSGTDHAIWRRIRLVPFSTTIPAEEQDPDLPQRLIADHAPAVLAWLVRGAAEWNRAGLGSASAVDAATAAYKSSQDTFGMFLSDTTRESARARTKVGDLFTRWKAWCETTGERPGRQQDFTQSLEDRGLMAEPYQGTNYVRGIELVSETDQAFDLLEREFGGTS